jgi:phosphoglycolate phosphatase-like HAD superfamily hydrolase
VKEKLMNCALTPQLNELMKFLPTQTKKYVVSGGLELELQDIFQRRGLDYFDGIFGGPRTKYQIIDDLKKINSNLLTKAVFVGDSKLDYQVAHFYHIDFIFMNQFSEFEHWPAFFQDKNQVRVIKNLQHLIG